jgi:predicted RNA-binding protein with PUA-like domain
MIAGEVFRTPLLSSSQSAGYGAAIRRMRYWLLKSEPDEFSIDDLAAAKGRTTAWFGVRNYQARNFMRDQMRLGDHAFFYHSSCPQPGIAGIVEVSAQAYPDATQFDRKSPYYDPKAVPEAPRWVNVDVTLVAKTRFVALAELRAHPELARMRVLQRGNRLSITPVDPAEWSFIDRLMGAPLALRAVPPRGSNSRSGRRGALMRRKA